MTIFTLGSTNTAALTVPGNYVAIVPPQIQYINGVPTGVLGIVGSAIWGPVGAPVDIGTYPEYVQNFGALQARRYDMGTAVAVAVQQGASAFQCVRCTDGTDTAAFVPITNGQLQSAYQIVNGSGYSAGYGTTICAVGTGSGLNLKATVSGGAITGVTVVAGGTGWGTTCTLSVKSGNNGGTGAVLTATVVSGAVTAVAVSGTMSGYLAGPTVTICSPAGSGASVQFPSGGGTLAAVTVINGGSGFTANPLSSLVADATGTGGSFSLAIGAVQVTSLYTGSGGNGISVSFAAGSAVAPSGGSCYKFIISAPGITNLPEVFDNIIQPAGQAFWPLLLTAVNNGTSARGKSQLVVLSQAYSNGGPTLSTNYALTGGTDGASGVGTSALLGTDGTTRTGMYGLRASGCSVAMLADCADSTSWSTQVSFALSEGIYMIDCGPVGDTISNAPVTKATAGIDTYAMKILFGDWVYWLDTVNGGQVRLIAPTAFSAGLLANLSPEQSSLNKQIQAVVGTQKTYTNTVYSQSDLSALAQAGIDVITNPAPGGSYFAPVIGRNASSNAVIHGDNYTRLTNFIAATINQWMGQVVGLLQNPTTRRQAFVLLDQFFFTLWQQGIIGNADGTQPYGIVLDDTNNPPARVALGYMQANVQVQYQSVIEYMLTEIEGGQSVQITRQAVAPALSN